MGKVILYLTILLLVGIETAVTLSSTELTRYAGIALLINGYVIGIVVQQLFRMAEGTGMERRRLSPIQKVLAIAVMVVISVMLIWFL